MWSCRLLLSESAAASLPWIGIESGLPSVPVGRSKPRSGNDRVGNQGRFCNIVGGVVSPLLANIYLHWFEVAFHQRSGPGTWAKARLIRYADDFVILSRVSTPRLIGWIEEMLEKRFRLTINREKTRVVNLDQPGASLTFLGFTMRYARDLYGRDRRYLNVTPSAKALARARAKIRELTDASQTYRPIGWLIGDVNRWLRSWANYYRYGYPRQAFRERNWYVETRLVRHLRRRSQRRYRPPEGRTFYVELLELGFQPL